MPHRTAWKIALLIFLASLPLKLLMAQNMAWEIDYVPLIWRGWEFLQGGPFPAVGTLSSVAAYNMPFLVWMQMPALALTHQAGLSLLLTMLFWNALTSAYLYALGRVMFRPSVGVIAVLLFSFSSSGISSTYTAWAQLLLPGFYAMTLYHLWQWARTDKAFHLTLCGLIALCAFMTHFSAIVLFPPMLVGGLLLRARWSPKALAVGVLIGAVLLAPYLVFEVGRGFVDLKAFSSRKVMIAPEIIAQYEPYKLENRAQLEALLGIDTDTSAPPTPNPSETVTLNPDPIPTEQPASSSLQDRLVERLQQNWVQVYAVLTFPARPSFQDAPQFNFILVAITFALWWAVLWALYRTGRLIWRSGRANAWTYWPESDAGRALFIAGFGLFTAGIIIALGAGQYTYYIGLLSPISLLIAYGLMEIWRYKILVGRLLVVGLIALWLVGNVADRLIDYQTHDDAQFTSFNTALYRHAEAVSDLIAQDWGDTGPVTVSYDLLPDVPNLWWLPAWNSIDPLYRMGTPYDVLLEMNHGLINRNTSALGPAEDADYVVVYTPSLARYDMADYQEVGRSGTTVVLKPVEK